MMRRRIRARRRRCCRCARPAVEDTSPAAAAIVAWLMIVTASAATATLTATPPAPRAIAPSRAPTPSGADHRLSPSPMNSAPSAVADSAVAAGSESTLGTSIRSRPPARHLALLGIACWPLSGSEQHIVRPEFALAHRIVPRRDLPRAHDIVGLERGRRRAFTSPTSPSTWRPSAPEHPHQPRIALDQHGDAGGLRTPGDTALTSAL